MTFKKLSEAILWFVLILGGTGLTGCRSGRDSSSTSHAAVRISDRSLVDIQRTTTTVFEEKGYSAATVMETQMVFERPGSSWDSAKWGGLVSGVTMRVKVRVSIPHSGDYLLEADAYAVQNSSDAFYRTESRNMLLSARPYQKLLDEVAHRLK